MNDDPLDLQIALGRTRLSQADARGLRKGSVVVLDGPIDEPVELRVGGRTIGRGEIVTIDGKLGVRVVELSEGQEAIE